MDEIQYRQEYLGTFNNLNSAVTTTTESFISLNAVFQHATPIKWSTEIYEPVVVKRKKENKKLIDLMELK